MGSDRSNADQQEKPAHKVTLAPFYIDATEVTCEDYQKFVKATGHKPPAKWLDGNCPSRERRKPVTGVDWFDAGAYAKWANKRLPTEEEWELAARGMTGWVYPWGDEWQKGVANADNAAAGIVDVASFKGTSPFQCYDMVGNAWEWTANKLVPYPGGRRGQEAGDDLRVIRGGSWQSDRDSATTTYRFGWPARGGRDYSNTGFRCALDAKQPEPAPSGR
jgi:formylglycine-generating enzyme required for sulfatase activity